MTFTSIEFLKWFLPAALLIGHIPVRKLKDPMLIVVSLAFYFMAGRAYFFFFCFSAFLTLVLGRVIPRTKRGGNLRFLLFSVGILYHLTILSFFKFLPGLWEGLNLEASTGTSLNILLPRYNILCCRLYLFETPIPSNGPQQIVSRPQSEYP